MKKRCFYESDDGKNIELLFYGNFAVIFKSYNVPFSLTTQRCDLKNGK